MFWGNPKQNQRKKKLLQLNPNLRLDIYETRLTSENALNILEHYDIIIDGTDNFQTRYLVNDACVILWKPNVYGSIFRFEGQASVFNYKTPNSEKINRSRLLQSLSKI